LFDQVVIIFLELIGFLFDDVLAVFVDQLLLFLVHLNFDVFVVVLKLFHNLGSLLTFLDRDLVVLAFEILGLVLVLLGEHSVLLEDCVGVLRSLRMKLAQVLLCDLLGRRAHDVGEGLAVEIYHFIIKHIGHCCDFLLIVLLVILIYFMQFTLELIGFFVLLFII